jgi:uncharacterized protein (TIGR02466 family)
MTKNDNEIIFPLFPTPVYISRLNRKLTKEELLFINKTKLDVYKNLSNTTSNDSYILNQKVFNLLKEDLYLRVQYYFKKILLYYDAVIPYITQSWLNYTEKDQHHHEHTHANSLVSGVLYINSDEKFDKIKFLKKDSYQTIKPEIKDWNLYNSDSWSFPVKTGDIILFPSSLNHMVDVKQGTNTRISLAFNTFIKGNLGQKNQLNELIL